MISADHGFYRRALLTFKSTGMSSDAIESRLASARLGTVVIVAEQVSSAILYRLVAYRAPGV